MATEQMKNAIDDDFSPDEMILRKKKAPEKKAGVTAAAVLQTAAAALEALRAKRPLVSLMAGHVTAGFTADALLALGASPMEVEDLGEASQLAGAADAMVVHTGTVTKPQTEVMRAAVSHANMGGRPWLLDPVAVGVAPLRTFIAKELTRRFPAVIRGNASEINYLAGAETAGRGTEATVDGRAVVAAALRLARVTRAAVLVSGATDFIVTEGAPAVAVANGAPLMARVAGTGGVQGAVAAAFLGALGSKARWEAACAAAVVTGVAGERAAAAAKGPGTFRAAFLDALYALTPDDLKAHAKITVEDAAEA